MLLLTSRQLVLTDLPQVGPLADQVLTLLTSLSAKLPLKDDASVDAEGKKAISLLLKRCIQVKNIVEYQEGLGTEVKPYLLDKSKIEASYEKQFHDKPNGLTTLNSLKVDTSSA